MTFQVITDDASGSQSFGDGDKYRFLDGSGVLQVDRADGTRLHFSPQGGWVRVEEAPRSRGTASFR